MHSVTRTIFPVFAFKFTQSDAFYSGANLGCVVGGRWSSAEGARVEAPGGGEYEEGIS